MENGIAMKASKFAANARRGGLTRMDREARQRTGLQHTDPGPKVAPGMVERTGAGMDGW